MTLLRANISEVLLSFEVVLLMISSSIRDGIGHDLFSGCLIILLRL